MAEQQEYMWTINDKKIRLKSDLFYCYKKYFIKRYLQQYKNTVELQGK